MPLFVDNIFRFVQAGSEVSTLPGRMPGRGLPAHPGRRDGRAAGHHHPGRSITSLQAVYARRRHTDPAPFTTFTHLTPPPSSPVRSPAGHLPGGRSAGVDFHHPRPRGRASVTTTWPARCRRCSSATRSSRTSSPSSVSTTLEEDRIVVDRARKVQRFLSAAVQRGQGVHGGLEWRHRLHRGHHRLVRAARQRRPDDLPEQAFSTSATRLGAG